MLLVPEGGCFCSKRQLGKDRKGERQRLPFLECPHGAQAVVDEV